MRDKNLPLLFLNLLRGKVIQYKNNVCVCALSVNFTVLYFMWFVLHFTVGVTGLLLSSCVFKKLISRGL